MVVAVVQPRPANVVMRACAVAYAASELVLVCMRRTDSVVTAGGEAPGGDFAGVEFFLLSNQARTAVQRRSGERGSSRWAGQSATPGMSIITLAQPRLVNSSERWKGERGQLKETS